MHADAWPPLAPLGLASPCVEACPRSAGDVMLIDFGLAYQIVDGQHDENRSMRVGCAGFMAPETYREQPCEVSADAFAFGQVLRRLLWRANPPARSVRTRAYFHALRWEILPTPSTYEDVHCAIYINPAWPGTHLRALRACSERRPERRPAMATLAKEFDECHAAAMKHGAANGKA